MQLWLYGDESMNKDVLKNQKLNQKKTSIKASVHASQKVLKKNHKKTNNHIREITQQIKEISEKIKKISIENYWIELVDNLAHNELVPLLQERDISVEKAWTHCKDRSVHNRWKIDMLAYSEKEMVAVNLYPFLDIRDVDNFIEMIKQFRQWSLLPIDKTLYGGVAYIKTFRKVEVYAENQGLFVIRVPA